MLVGHLAWIALRLLMVTSIYLAIMAAFGTVHSPLAILAIPVGVLTGLAFAAPIAAFAATQENDTGFSTIYRFGLIPLFLFSGTFFPITQLPGWLQPVAEATPLYHGVALCRALVLGQRAAGRGRAPTLAYLVALTAVGFAARPAHLTGGGSSRDRRPPRRAESPLRITPGGAARDAPGPAARRAQHPRLPARAGSSSCRGSSSPSSTCCRSASA